MRQIEAKVFILFYNYGIKTFEKLHVKLRKVQHYVLKIKKQNKRLSNQTFASISSAFSLASCSIKAIICLICVNRKKNYHIKQQHQ